MHQLESANNHVHNPETETLSRLLYIQWNDHYFLAPINSVLTEKNRQWPLCWSLIVLNAWGLSMEGPMWRKGDWTIQPNYCNRWSIDRYLDSLSHSIPHTSLPTYTDDCLALWHTDNSLMKASVLPQIYSTKGYSRLLLHVLFQQCHSNGRGEVQGKHIWSY